VCSGAPGTNAEYPSMARHDCEDQVGSIGHDCEDQVGSIGHDCEDQVGSIGNEIAS
jgi:hypothetical protein